MIEPWREAGASCGSSKGRCAPYDAPRPLPERRAARPNRGQGVPMAPCGARRTHSPCAASSLVKTRSQSRLAVVSPGASRLLPLASMSLPQASLQRLPRPDLLHDVLGSPNEPAREPDSDSGGGSGSWLPRRWQHFRRRYPSRPLRRREQLPGQRPHPPRRRSRCLTARAAGSNLRKSDVSSWALSLANQRPQRACRISLATANMIARSSVTWTTISSGSTASSSSLGPTAGSHTGDPSAARGTP